MKALSLIKIEHKIYYVDERLKELRNLDNISDKIRLNEFEIEYYKIKSIRDKFKIFKFIIMKTINKKQDKESLLKALKESLCFVEVNL
jgi:hypothetical protein